MTLESLKELNLPKTPGVYLFKKEGVIAYIGKATSLADRTKSYFSSDLAATRGPKIVQMIEAADTVETISTDSVLEALILEARLIKKHQPYFNTREKDDKSYWHVAITKEEFPRVLLVRAKELFGLTASEELLPERLEATYGPFPQGFELKEAMKIIRKIFPYRDTCEIGSPRACFNARIGLCPGVCDGRIPAQSYRKIIRHIKLFFEGKKSQIIKELERDMKRAVRTESFEDAAGSRNKIFALTHIQDVALLKRESAVREGYRIEAYDIAHISGSALVGVMVVSTGGELDKEQYRKFKMKLQGKNDDTGNLEELLRRRFGHPEWRTPDLVVIDGGAAQRNRAHAVLTELGINSPIVCVVKNEHHRPERIVGDSSIVADHHHDILLVNSEAHRFAVTYHKHLRGRHIPKVKK